MATVNIKLSQDVIDQQHALAQQGSPYNSIDGLLGAANPADYGIGADIDLVSWNLANAQLNLNYTQGVTETYIGFAQDNPRASSGHATATAYELHEAGAFRVKATGRLNLDYALGSGNDASLETAAEGHWLQQIYIATEYATTSPGYDPVFGNVSLAVNGRINLGPTGSLDGSLVNEITVMADKLLQHASVEGSFLLDAKQAGGLGGVVSGYHEYYHDNSVVAIDGLGADATRVGALDTVYTNAALMGGNDDIAIDLPDHLYASVTVRSGAGADRISLKGGGGMLGVDAGAGNDVIVLLGGAHTVDGGAGFDIAQMALTRAAVSVQRVVSASGTTTGYTVTDAAGVVVQLANVERITFSDTAYALDIDGNAGQAYRLYQAAFDRTPDAGGLGFWIHALDQGVSLRSVAQGFVDSQEYRDTYGYAVSNLALVKSFYDNILHRTPDAAGLGFWTGVLDRHDASTAEVLAAISESAENRDGMVALIGNGFAYTPYGQG
jgi:hypothetical protein